MKKIIFQKNKRGFVILFAVTLSAILLSIALGVANVALKEVRFGTNAHDTNDAFFAADTGAECAFFNDKSTSSVFVSSPPHITCNSNDVVVTKDSSLQIWSFVLSGVGPQAKGCAKVTVDKSDSPIVITSNGYNTGGSSSGACTPGLNSVERQIESRY